MPYICMARNDIPDGVLQVLDLAPNTSLRVPAVDPAGQTRYINRTPRSAIGVVGANGTLIGGVGNRAIEGQLFGLEAYLIDRIDWNSYAGLDLSADITAAAAALQARVDGGLALEAADIKAALDPITGGDLDGVGDNSSYSVIEILSILAGRQYAVPVLTDKFPAGSWDATQFGSFSETVLVNDTEMVNGELRPANVGGDPVAVERKPVRYLWQNDAFNESRLTGALSSMKSNVTLFVDNIYSAFKPGQPSQPGPQVAEASAPLVTVYDDDGTLL